MGPAPRQAIAGVHPFAACSGEKAGRRNDWARDRERANAPHRGATDTTLGQRGHQTFVNRTIGPVCGAEADSSRRPAGFAPHEAGCGS
jgi:hypothetical protein